MVVPNPERRILFLTQVLPYPLSGGAKIRAYYMLRYLAQTYRVTLVSFIREDDHIDALDHLRQFCEAVYTVPMTRTLLKTGRSLVESVARNKPLVILRDRLPEMENLLRDLVGRVSFDVIHADQTSMAQYGLFAREACRGQGKPSTLLDQHNALYLLFQRQSQHERGKLRQMMWARESKLLKRYESSLLRDYDEILTVTDNDYRILLDLLAENEKSERREHITAVPICVDPENQSILHLESSTSTIIHLGTMFWPPNIEGVLWFAYKVLPLILESLPDVNFIIAGKNPPKEIEILASSSSPVADHVKVTGFVPDPESLLTSSQVFVVPLLAGGGMRVKILDAWQWGLPIVSTAIGAEGIHIQDGANILIADEAPAFADAVIRILTDPELADNLRDNGRRWVEQQYDWRKVYRKMDQVYSRLVTSH